VDGLAGHRVAVAYHYRVSWVIDGVEAEIDRVSLHVTRLVRPQQLRTIAAHRREQSTRTATTASIVFIESESTDTRKRTSTAFIVGEAVMGNGSWVDG